MKKAQAILEGKRAAAVVMTALFLLMLAFNFMTPYIADDYSYMVSFYDKKPIENIIDAAKSLYAHAFHMNGRLVSHGLEMIFLLLPKAVFNICNSAAFVFVIYLIYRISLCGKGRNIALFAAAAMAVWCFTPAFGETALWQIGSLNYIWAAGAALVFLLPYICVYMGRGQRFKSTAFRVVFVILSFFIGMYSEISSFTAIFMAVILLSASLLSRKIKPRTWLWLPIVSGALGFICMLLMPAELSAKVSGSLTLETLMESFVSVTEKYEDYLLTPALMWAALLAASIYKRVCFERLFLSGLFVVGSLTGNYMMIISSYYPERCMCTPTIYLITAALILVPALVSDKRESEGTEGQRSSCGQVAFICAGILTVTFLFEFVYGSYDIYHTYTSYTAREAVIEEYLEAGETDVKLQIIHPATKYSAFYGITDLTKTTDTWTNNYFALYYGFNTVTGY
ncbi:MAG: DUF6056 family protein [Firmicutes bacterium]|nr:DUF6056 family protein [Bacillota bacterium]